MDIENYAIYQDDTKQKIKISHKKELIKTKIGIYRKVASLP